MPSRRRRAALSAGTGSMRDRLAMYNANALKIGMFGANCSSARTATKVPERWSASWPDNLRLARMADEAGIDFMLPIARWKGYGGDTDFPRHDARDHHLGLRAARRRPTASPCSARCMAAVSSGDRGQGDGHRRPHRRRPLRLNIVAGWNEAEFEMFGVNNVTTIRAMNTRTNGSTSSSAPGPIRTSSTSTAVSSSSRACAPFPNRSAGRGR